MRSRGYVLKQNAPFRTIVKRDTPPGWTAIWVEGGNDSFTPCKGALLWGTLRSEIGWWGGVDLPTDGKSPAQIYGETP